MTRRESTSRLPTHRPGPGASTGGAGRRRHQRPDRRLRLALFSGIALVVGALAVSLVVSRLQPPGATDATALQVHTSMGGFEPAALAVKAGQEVRIELANMDTQFHADGGGWHEFAVDELGVDWKVGPEESRVFTLTAPAAGTYTWYCGICCGGRDNPSMRGTLTVTA
ncbi:MAG: cupredoxin domain-containing protein [Chloroflexi bacterium]|nr:cupredoxin domain-containing protein [Chloroflexota bacterium]MDA8236904.1 cupredoxin domain-containing protein [Chloroflexota bacterium]